MAMRRASTGLMTQWMRVQGQAHPGLVEAAVMANETAQGPVQDIFVRYASLQAIKQRMKSVTNIQKITKAMKMVAASKMRLAQAATEQSRGMVSPFIKLLGDMPGVDVDNNVTVPITSDKGLCGGINTTISKYTRATDRIVESMGGGDKKHSLFIIGDKGRSQLARQLPNKISFTVADTAKGRITYALAANIAEEILKTEYDAVRFLFNRFRSAISFLPTVATVVSPETLERATEAGGSLDQYEIEGPDRAEMFQDLGEFQLATVLYNAMLENNCSENASRMSAMENSTKNASEMLGKLALTYNRGRQASITTELIEIISGASALEG